MVEDDGTTTSTEAPTGETTNERGRVSRPSVAASVGQRYFLGESIGRGGMGEVIAAVDEQIGRVVAIKRIRGGTPSDRTVTRFLREAKIQGRLEHPAIPPVHELGRDSEGRPFFVMKKLSGTTLKEIVEAKDRGAEHTRHRLLRAFSEVCLAVEFAHVNGVIHRDLKPSNIMLGAFGEVYVLDWGIAKVLADDDQGFDDIISDDLETRAGAVVGTVAYMAPEQARGDKDIDARADVYALGRVLHEILACDDEEAPELDAACSRALALDRDMRMPTARALAEAVLHFLDGDRDLAMRKKLAQDHLARARAALEHSETAEGRRDTMYQAGRALALDPSLPDGAEIIGRLMIDLPATDPPEVTAEMRRSSAKWIREFATGMAWGFLGYLLLIPSLVSGGWPVIFPVAFAVLFGAGLVVATARGRILPPTLLATSGALQVAVLSFLYTPALIAGLAVLIAMQLSLNPFLRTRDSAYLIMANSFAVLSPLIAGALGWIEPIMQRTPEGLAFRIYGSDAFLGIEVVIAIGSFMLVAVAVFVGSNMRVSQLSATRQQHLQQWQLRQLLPRTASP